MKHLQYFKQFEDATGSATTAGMGAVTSAQPSANSGSLNGSDFTNGGGTVGSGDISSNFGTTVKRKKKDLNYSKIHPSTK